MPDPVCSLPGESFVATPCDSTKCCCTHAAGAVLSGDQPDQNDNLSIHIALSFPFMRSFPLVIVTRPQGDVQNAHSFFSYNWLLL
jgi:hypothetical protein